MAIEKGITLFKIFSILKVFISSKSTLHYLCNMSDNLDISQTFLRGCMLYDFKSGMKATASCRRICDAFGNDIISERVCQNWFLRFKKGDCSLSDKPRSGRPSTVDNDALKNLVEESPRSTTREYAETLGCAQSTVVTHLESLGKVPKLGVWVPHLLSQRNREQRLDACTSLLSYSRRTDWLDTVITGDEKWVLYVNVARKHSWVDKNAPALPTAKPEVHQRKVMLSVWWDSQGVLLFELLPPNRTITADYYCEQLERLREEIIRLRPLQRQVRFLHDNARPHVATVTRQKLLDLGWEVLVHPPYSPDLAPSDFHLFRSLQNHLRGKEYVSNDQIERDLRQFFESKPRDFFKRGIHNLPDRWRKVLAADGEYFVD